MSKTSQPIRPKTREQTLDTASVSETICVTVYGSDLEKFSEARLSVPDGTFRVQISWPENEISV